MATVIVPAHNEENVIKRCLDSIVGQQGIDKIIVACNGCTDATVSLVRADYPDVICLDIVKPSKVNALNEAEKLIEHWPVFYIDADVALSGDCISTISNYMETHKIHLCAPEPVIDLKDSPWLVKKYYEVWLQLPYIRSGVIATCSFVLSKQGRERFSEFPDVIADDYFVRSQFEESELCNVPDTNVFVKAPRSFWSLVKIKTRSKLGVMEVDSKGLGIKKEKPNYPSALKTLFFSKFVISTLCYILMVTFFKIRAKLQFRKLSTYEWEVDKSSR